MSWKIDDIDFGTYGVGVTKVTGLFDMPKLLNEPIDWLDEAGEDYWFPVSAQKFDKKTINLYCYILATSYADFISKLKSFYDAIIALGMRTLLTPYISTEIECYLNERISIDRLDRGARYVNSKQAGVFVLNLTVPGDSEYDYITIYDKSSSAVKEIIKTKNLVVQKTLQGEEYATCTSETNQPLISGMYEYIKVNSDGIGFDYFLLTSSPSVRKESTNKYVYDLRFEGITLHFKQMKFTMFGQAEFEFFGNLQDVVQQVCSNVNRFIWFTDRFFVGSCASTVKRLHNFSNEDCLSVLQRICSEYEMEYRFERQPDTTYNLYISDFAGKTNTVGLEYGKGNSLYQVSRGDMDTSKLCTVLWAFGAAKNLPVGYRNGLKRLSFDANPLKANEATYGTWEHVVNFDDIFPNRTATVTGYLQVLPENLTQAEKEVHPNGIFAVGDTGLSDPTYGFDINNYLLGGLTAKIAMKTGDLAGYQFDIERYDPDSNIMYIIRFKDEARGLLPDATFQIAPGDQYTLVDMNQPPIYITEKETALQAAAQEYLDKWSLPAYQYNVKTNPAFIQANPGTGFNVGDIMTIYDAELGIDTTNRVTSLSYIVRSKVYELTLSVFKKLPKRAETEFRLQTIERAIFTTRKETGEVIRDDLQPTGELRRTLLDQDNKLNVDNIVRNNSIDPGMISHDLALPTLILKNAWLALNVDGDEDKISVEAGELTLRNFYPKSRYEIQKIKDDGGTYDPTRTWTIPATNFTLASKNAHYLYAKVDIAAGQTVATLEVSETYKEIKHDIENGILTYPINYISAGEETP